MYHPLRSLREGSWFKLICGASFQHLPAVRSLTLAYALAGADCIDVAADPAVIDAARAALHKARLLMPVATDQGFKRLGLPWLMVSLNDGEDPHFRKAEFDPDRCPVTCPRPCETICPAQAIVFAQEPNGFSGVVDRSCYGCGRCLSVCPIDQISTRSYVATPAAVAPLVLAGVDAVEIHTQVGRYADFERLWQAIVPFLPRLKLIAISCPDGDNLIPYLRSLYKLVAPLPCPLIWQTDGRPMSGDIGDGATRAAVKLGQKVLAANLPGYVQLAGGTNRYTLMKLAALGLLKPQLHPEAPQRYVAGIAYGSYARSLLAPVLEQLEQRQGDARLSSTAPIHSGSVAAVIQPPLLAPPLQLEDAPDLLWQAVRLAYSLVSPLKTPMNQLSLSILPEPSAL